MANSRNGLDSVCHSGECLSTAVCTDRKWLGESEPFSFVDKSCRFLAARESSDVFEQRFKVPF